MAYTVKKGGVIKAVNKSKRFNDKRYRGLLTIIKNWNSKKKRVHFGDKTMKLTEFKSMNKSGYVAINKYEVEGLTLSNETKARQLYRLPSKKDKEGGIVVPMRRVFDAIKSAHIHNKHTKVLATYKKLRPSILEYHRTRSERYIVTCPVCNSAPPKSCIIKGTKTPICLNKFGDRVQVDLIDMRRYRQKGEASHMMRYIVTGKDHFSGFVMLDAISEKTPTKVAHVLQRMFGTIGYPRILHVDNRCEFTGRILLLFSAGRKVESSVYYPICAKNLVLKTIYSNPLIPMTIASIGLLSGAVRRFLWSHCATIGVLLLSRNVSTNLPSSAVSPSFSTYLVPL